VEEIYKIAPHAFFYTTEYFAPYLHNGYGESGMAGVHKHMLFVTKFGNNPLCWSQIMNTEVNYTWNCPGLPYVFA